MLQLTRKGETEPSKLDRIRMEMCVVCDLEFVWRWKIIYELLDKGYTFDQIRKGIAERQFASPESADYMRSQFGKIIDHLETNYILSR